MKVAVISDLHLGRGDKTDLFWHDDHEFVMFLKYLEHNFEKIVLLGDIYETLAAKPWQQLKEIQIIREAHPEIVRRFSRPQYDFVVGNHDIVLLKHDALEELNLEADGVRLHFRHGHKFDWMFQHIPWLPELGVWLGFMFARWGFDWFYRVGDQIDQWFSSKDGPAPFERWAIDIIAPSQNADIIVTGHTHHGMMSRHDSRLFLNSGACYKGKVSWLAIDTKSDTYQHLGSW